METLSSLNVIDLDNSLIGNAHNLLLICKWKGLEEKFSVGCTEEGLETLPPFGSDGDFDKGFKVFLGEGKALVF